MATIVDRYFINVLNLSQLTTVKTGTKINPEKAREVLDTNIFELLPTQTTRQDQINDFFNEFNDLIGQAPAIQDVDGDGVSEYIQPQADLLDRQGRVSIENKSTAYITRLNTHANTNNQGKTLESMRNKLNTYLGDVDNVVQVIEDQRPEYENKSSGFLKIRKPNQAIILRNPNQMLEFQKDNSYLTDGFTITMWVRFVGKTGRGTLFNFGNPLSSESPYGFRLETITREDAGVYRRMVRLVVRDHLSTVNGTGKVYDSHVAHSNRNRRNTVSTNEVHYGSVEEVSNGIAYSNSLAVFRDSHSNAIIPTNDLNEWFFICATYNPDIDEDNSFGLGFETDKQFWLNHVTPYTESFEEGAEVGVGDVGTIRDESELYGGDFRGDPMLQFRTNEVSEEFGNMLLDEDDGGNISEFMINSGNAFVITNNQTGEQLTVKPNTGNSASQYDTRARFGFSSTYQAMLNNWWNADNTPLEVTVNSTGVFAEIITTNTGVIVANSGLGARCKVEVISRSDLLRARGYKVDSLEVNVEEETTEQEQQQSGN